MFSLHISLYAFKLKENDKLEVILTNENQMFRIQKACPYDFIPTLSSVLLKKAHILWGGGDMNVVCLSKPSSERCSGVQLMLALHLFAIIPYFS